MIKRKLFVVIPVVGAGGGAAKFVGHLINNLNETKYDIYLVVNKIDTLDAFRVPPHVKMIHLKVRRSRYAVLFLILAIWKKKPDVVLTTMGYLNLLVATLRFLLPKDTVVIARETNTVSVKNQYQERPWLFDALYRLFYKRLDKIVCQSRYMSEDLNVNFKVPISRLTVINNPADEAAIDVATEGVKERAGRLVCMGRLSHQKGYDMLLEALALMTIPCEVEIFGVGPELTALEKNARQLGVDGRVSFMGHTPHAYRELASAHAMLLPSRYEGLPNAVIEAHFCGVPVVAFDCPGGVSELIVDGENGFLVEKEDVQGFAHAVSSALRHDFDRQKIRCTARARYALAGIMTQYEDLIDSTTRHSGSPMPTTFR